MDNNGVLLIVFDVVLGWFYLLLGIMSIMVIRGQLKSRDNYRPWKPFELPEDLADKANKEGAKWIIAIVLFAIGLLIIETFYGLTTGDYGSVLLIVIVPIILLFALIVGVYLYAWNLVKLRNAGNI